jgi:NAD(P)-dependent dehydrogenase (short-subunit alcohol dehydrogenase family)
VSRILLITGGGRGIGAATARLAAARGYAVCINYRRRREDAEAVVKSIETEGGRAIAVAAYGGRGGAIVNVSSAAVRLGSAGEYVDYAASKGAMDTLTLGLAREVAEEGIRVNAVRPGFIYTEMHDSGGEPGRVDRVKDLVPMKRGGSAGEVAHAILWLLSDEASFTTGSFIDVAGGR